MKCESFFSGHFGLRVWLDLYNPIFGFQFCLFLPSQTYMALYLHITLRIISVHTCLAST